MNTIQNILSFLNELDNNNYRDWFRANKDRYTTLKEEFEQFIDGLIAEISGFDKRISGLQAKACTFRIYRDVRFSKNKLPYKDHFGAYMAAGGRKSVYAGYYLHVSPHGSFVAGGVYQPPTPVLKAIRTDIFHNPETIKQLLADKEFSRYFTEIFGEKLKTAPRGFPKDFADVELLRYKSYAVSKDLYDKDLKDKMLTDNLLAMFRASCQFNEYLNQIIDNQ